MPASDIGLYSLRTRLALMMGLLFGATLSLLYFLNLQAEREILGTIEEGGYADIIIVGGGTTGIAAAVSAARDGAKVCIIEYYGFLGGNATTGLPWMAYHNLVVRRSSAGTHAGACTCRTAS